MKKNVPSALIVVAFVALTACNSPAVEPTTAPLIEATTESPAESPTLPPAEPPVAVSVFGEGTFTLDIPDGWDVFGPQIVSSDPDRPYELYMLGEDPSISGGPGLSRVVVADADLWTPEDFVLSQCSTCPENPFESVTVGGRPAVRTEVGGGGVPIMVTWTFVENEGKFIAFALHDPQTLEPLEDVIASIQFE